MQENTIFVKKYSENQISPVNQNEVWRYAGYAGATDGISSELKDELSAVIGDLGDKFSYKVCYRQIYTNYPLMIKSKSLENLLKDCSKTVLFAATIGLETDRYIARMQKISPLKALLANALGAERIEALCDAFCDELKSEFEQKSLYLTKRFSPGYGDLPITAQNELFDLLDPSRQIGVSLNESFLMSPSKSVTAIMGIKNTKCDITTHKCSECNNKECQFRKRETK